jgi:hypothetical protein
VDEKIKEELEIYAIISLSKEQRQSMSAMLRKDPLLWNALNGQGGLSESSSNGLIIGIIHSDSGPVVGAEVAIENGEKNKITLITNQYGHYEAELVPDDYDITVSIDGVSSDPKTITLEAGATEFYAYNPDEIPGEPDPPEEPEG